MTTELLDQAVVDLLGALELLLVSTFSAQKGTRRSGAEGLLPSQPTPERSAQTLADQNIQQGQTDYGDDEQHDSYQASNTLDHLALSKGAQDYVIIDEEGVPGSGVHQGNVYGQPRQRIDECRDSD